MLTEQTHMDRMILGAMQRIAPDVVASCWNKCRSKHGNGQSPYKEMLLQELMDAQGPNAVLELSEHFPENTSSSPLVYLLLNSPGPEAMIKKLTLYDRHFHPTRRFELCESGSNHVVTENVACPDDKPSVPDELFLCGAVKTMLTLLGCEGLHVEWSAVCSEQMQQVLKSLNIPPPSIGKNTQWRFSWNKYKRRDQITGLDDFLISNTEPFTISNKTSVTHLVEKLLEMDLTTRPSMQDVAVKLGMSVRTFQRKMREEGITYSRLYNKLRIKTASRLLRQTDTSLTEIGFICGFSDSAHFSREFKKVQMMTPKTYRETYQMNNEKSFEEIEN